MDENLIDVESAMATAADLRDIVGKLKRRMREEYSSGGFTLTQMSVLSRLHRHGPATVTSLARAEGMRPQSMGATIATLEDAGLVAGTPDPSDGRQTVISITTLCREKVAEVHAAKRDWLFRSIRAKFSSDEQKQLASAVLLLKKLVDE